VKGSEVFREDYPTCPYCGHKDTEWWDGGLSDNEGWGDSVEWTCDHCDKKYYTSRECLFSSEPSCDLNNIECDLEEMIIESDYKICKNCENRK
jgi:hypothetical protein